MKNFAKAVCVSLIASASLETIAIAPARAQPAEGYVEAGVLNCDISAGIGFIIGSKKEVTCLFKPVNDAQQEVYIGAIKKFGLDLGATGPGQMIWSVYSPTTREYGALAGNYVGATAQATVIAGLGANVLVGGSRGTIALQPLSVQGQVGLNIAIGVGELSLRPISY
jgi:hypothetical protein